MIYFICYYSISLVYFLSLANQVSSRKTIKWQNRCFSMITEINRNDCSILLEHKSKLWVYIQKHIHPQGIYTQRIYSQQSPNSQVYLLHGRHHVDYVLCKHFYIYMKNSKKCFYQFSENGCLTRILLIFSFFSFDSFLSILIHKVEDFENKAKRQISKRRWQLNKAHQIFHKTNISYPLICTHACVYQVARNIWFSGNSACFVFLLPPVWDSSFCLISNEESFTLVDFPTAVYSYYPLHVI